MAFQSVPNTVEVIVRMTVNLQPIVNTFYARRAGGYVLTDITNLATAMDLFAAAEYIPLLSTESTYDGVTVRGLENENDFAVDDSTSAGAGTKASRPMPGNVAYVVTRRSLLTGRSARGRVYLPMTEADRNSSEENRVSDAFRTAAEELCEACDSYMVANGWIPVIVSRFSGGVARAVGEHFDIAYWDTVDNRVDTQRRRLPAN